MNFDSHTNARRILINGLAATLLVGTVTASAFGAHRLSDLNEQQIGLIEGRPHSPSAVVFRAKPSMARQPRPASAPIRHLDQRADGAVKLLGVESLHE